MNKDEALKLALKELLCYQEKVEGEWGSCRSNEKLEADGETNPVITLIKEALLQPAEQEPALQRLNDYMVGFNEGYDRATKQSLAQPEPVMDYDKEELRGTVWDTSKQTLAQPKQEPVGYLCDWGNNYLGLTRQVFYYGAPGSAIGNDWYGFPKVHENLPLYTSPPKREWVGLTDDEIALYDLSRSICVVTLVASILKEKNT